MHVDYSEQKNRQYTLMSLQNSLRRRREYRQDHRKPDPRSMTGALLSVSRMPLSSHLEKE